MVIRAAQAGVRAIFCEKPLATSLPEARRMIGACREHGAILLVNHLRRWGWDYRAVRKMLRKGAIGRVQSAAGCFSGNLLHTGTHLFDILRFLFGEWTSARGRLAGDEGAKGVSGYHLHDTRGGDYADPGVIGTLIFENGVEVFVSGLPRDYFIFELDIVGSKGRIRIGNHLLEWWKPAKSRYYASFIDLARAPFPRPARRPNPWLEALADIRRVLERGAAPASTGTDGLKSLEAAFALAMSSRGRGVRVSPPVAGTRLRIRAK
jgi:predicted dehydrogenase